MPVLAANLDICADDFYSLLFDIQRDAMPIETLSSVARDMKAPDAFEFNWRTVEDRENPAELFPTKARGGVLGVGRLNAKFFPSISPDRPVDPPEFGEKLRNGTRSRGRENLVLDDRRANTFNL